MLVPQSYELSLAALQRAKVLEEIKPENLPKDIVKTIGPLSAINLQVLSCCDGHQFMHVTQHTQFCCEQAKRQLGVECLGDDCFHWKTENGGPFALSVPDLRTRTYRGRVNDVELNTFASMHEGMNLKKLDVVLLIAHMRCGKVHDLFTSPDDYCAALAKAKVRVMQEFGLPSGQVIAWLQVHRPTERSMFHLDHSTVAARIAA
jgi:hypothetical protein